ncbi:hypothetical protein ES705_16712 [subsurface metagenome]
MVEGLIQNYGEIGALGAFVLLMIWYVRFQTKTQAKREEKQDEERIRRETKRDEERKEEMLFNRNLLINDIKSIHAISLENSKLNGQGMVLQKEMIKDLREHNGYCKEASKKIIESFSAVIDKINGKN